MPSVGKAQRSVACMAEAMMEGKMSKSRSAQAAKMAASMSKEEISKLCHTTDEEMASKK